MLDMVKQQIDNPLSPQKPTPYKPSILQDFFMCSLLICGELHTFALLQDCEEVRTAGICEAITR
jgi:hypothetical protein